MTYGVLSDLHCHAWSTYATVDADGVNSRLRIILNEMERAAAGLVLAGGSTMVIAGDIFHVRGSIDPEVLNPVQSVIQKLLDDGINIYAIPGNHDLKSSDTNELSSAVQTLAHTASDAGKFITFNVPSMITTDDGYQLAFVPWRNKVDDVISDLHQLKNAVGDPDLTDVFIHAGIDGVLTNMPDHGLAARRLAEIGFRRVFAGHYHHHKHFVWQDIANEVVSIGATTHQTWSDVGTKAGFLLVDHQSVLFQDSHAPKFVDVSGMTETEMQLASDGNYIRFRGDPMSTADLDELKDFFVKSGALGTSIQAPKKAASQRANAAPTASGQSLGRSVSTYIDQHKDIPAHVPRDLVKISAAAVLSKAAAVYEQS